MGEAVDPVADVSRFIDSVTALLADPVDLAAADPGADAAENHAIVVANARHTTAQARRMVARAQSAHTHAHQVHARARKVHRARRATAIVHHLEALRHRHPEFRYTEPPGATGPSPDVQQATGMIMLMVGLDGEHAAQLLGLVSWSSGRAPDEIARQMVARCTRGEDPIAVVMASGPDVGTDAGRMALPSARLAHCDMPWSSSSGTPIA